MACGYHAGDEETMREVVEISKQNNVSIGAHPSFNDPENFGRKRINLSSSEIRNKVIRHLTQKGWETDLIIKCLNRPTK